MISACRTPTSSLVTSLLVATFNVSSIWTGRNVESILTSQFSKLSEGDEKALITKNSFCDKKTEINPLIMQEVYSTQKALSREIENFKRLDVSPFLYGKQIYWLTHHVKKVSHPLIESATIKEYCKFLKIINDKKVQILETKWTQSAYHAFLRAFYTLPAECQWIISSNSFSRLRVDRFNMEENLQALKDLPFSKDKLGEKALDLELKFYRPSYELDEMKLKLDWCIEQIKGFHTQSEIHGINLFGTEQSVRYLSTWISTSIPANQALLSYWEAVLCTPYTNEIHLHSVEFSQTSFESFCVALKLSLAKSRNLERFSFLHCAVDNVNSLKMIEKLMMALKSCQIKQLHLSGYLDDQNVEQIQALVKDHLFVQEFSLIKEN